MIYGNKTEYRGFGGAVLTHTTGLSEGPWFFPLPPSFLFGLFTASELSPAGGDGGRAASIITVSSIDPTIGTDGQKP